MEASVERALRLVQDLLDFTQARIGSGLTVTLQSVDIHRVVAEAIEELRLAFPERTVIHVQHGGGQSSADPDRLLQMLGNLVGNAMAYGAVDQPVTITTRVGIDSFAIEVHNSGKPISQDLLPVLFEPMTRGTPTGGGQRSVGLGLFIVKDIVRAHRGSVEVTSDTATGTLFRVEFPRAQ
jgi:sigma-B regulation protein RsbU (phosphoserine phosphatase)